MLVFLFLLFVFGLFIFYVDAVASTEFDGEGTAENPYQIKSADDLVRLAKMVNIQEKSYYQQHFALTHNIDMSGIEFTPIGVFGSGHYFFGVLDGNGYTIKNISINIPDSNNGIFGMLGGTVCNLTIDGGMISGACCGIISSHAAIPQAVIANCKINNVTVDAFRAGGVVDNFSGSVLNCITTGCKLIGTNNYGGISSYAIEGDSYGNYYSISANNKPEAMEVFVEGSEQIDFYNADVEKVAEKLNTNYRHHSIYSAKDFGIFNIWVSSAEGNLELSDTKQIERFLSNISKLSGRGSMDDPYYINNADDLSIFRDAVNSGYDFYNEYVRQNADIDLVNEVWTPIGQYGEGNYFYGTYDGNGHVISNIYTVNDNTGGFFGVLGGTVANLGIESGLIQGRYCGGITALAASSSAMVVNCYNKADVVGISRAGGIVDNFQGSVIGCWSDCNLKGDIIGGISSYYAQMINMCKTSFSVLAPEDTMTGIIVGSDANTILSGDETQKIKEELNNSISRVKKLSGVKIPLYSFSTNNRQLCFSDKPYTLNLTEWINNHTVLVAFLVFVIVILCLSFFKVGPQKLYEDDRKWWKKFILVFAPVFLFFYMFLIHSPIEFFIINNSEFDFVFGDFAYKYITLALLGSVLISALFASLAGKICDVLTCAVLGLNLGMYIQLNFMNNSLGLLDGTEKKVDVTGNYINILIWIILFILPFILYIFIKNWRKVIVFVCGTLCLMQITSIVTLIVQSPNSVFERKTKQYYLAANEQYTVSADNNIIILVIDAYSNSYINEFFEKYPEVKDVVKDFTYYSNTDCHYEGSVFSINYIASGTEWNPSISIDKWCSTAWKNEKNRNFYSRLNEKNYVFNIYTNQIDYLSNDAKEDMIGKVANIVEMEYNYQINDEVMFDLFTSASIYRFVPMLFKEQCQFTATDYGPAYVLYCKSNNSIDTNVRHDNAEFYQDLMNKRLKTNNSHNYYILQHLAGVHGPYNVNEDCQEVPESTLLETERGCWRYIEEYINQLKELGVYDNSTIIITADHGEHHEYNDAQPIFFVKSINESHNEYVETNAPISFTDLMPTILYLSGADYSDFGTTIYEHSEDEQRERTLFVRMYDTELPDVPKRDSPTKSKLNCFYKYVYTGDIEDLRELGKTGPTEKIPWTDAFY